jgi:hypothetical protein
VLTVLLGLGGGVAIAEATSEETAGAETATDPRDRADPPDTAETRRVVTTSTSTTSTTTTPRATLPARATYTVTVTGGPYAECSGTITATLEAGTITLLFGGGGGAVAPVKPDGTFSISYSNPQVSGAVAGVLDATTLRASAYQFTPDGTECTYVLNGTRSS